MSIIDNFMSQVIDLNEKEKEEVILFLAESLICENPGFVRNISKKVTIIVVPFLTDVLVKKLSEKEIKGGEKVGVRKESKKD